MGAFPTGVGMNRSCFFWPIATTNRKWKSGTSRRNQTIQLELIKMTAHDIINKHVKVSTHHIVDRYEAAIAAIAAET